MELIFRETQPTDVEGLFTVRTHTRENTVSREHLAVLGITPQSVARDMASGKMKSWVCLDQTNLVGFCNGDSTTGEVLVLAVLPEYEGKGIGTRLLAHVVEHLRSIGFGEAWLATTSDSRIRAHGFYRSLGWQSTGEKLAHGDEILALELNKPARPITRRT